MADTSLRAVGWAQAFPASGGVRAGRQWAREHLESLGWAEEAPETVDAVLLTVSELITNAHVHAHSDAQLVLTWDGRCLHVTVGDSGTGRPAPRAPDSGRPSGRGLVIVDALADHWETRTHVNSKMVTACFRPSGAPYPHRAAPGH